jgi:hypothetical protein
MAEIARDGKGRELRRSDPQAVPQIFTTETLLISRDLLIEQDLRAAHGDGGGTAAGIDAGVAAAAARLCPHLSQATLRAAHESGRGSAAVSWRHGLGRVMAFTSDLSGRWGREWVAWQGLPQWAGQLGARHHAENRGNARCARSFMSRATR